jgi:hypothetical protein
MIKELRNNLSRMNKAALIVQAVRMNEALLLKLNQSQLEQGITSKGAKITPKYSSEPYAERKSKLNPKPGFGTPDLKLKGLLYADMFVKISKDKYETNSAVSYAQYVIPRYADVMGLTEENKKIAQGVITASYVKLWTKALGL